MKELDNESSKFLEKIPSFREVTLEKWFVLFYFAIINNT
jgi:hypothetical protein